MGIQNFIRSFINHFVSPFRLILISNHQKLLLYNNILLFLWSVVLFTFSMYVCILFYNSTEKDNTIYIGWLGLCIVSVFLMTICIIGMRAAHLVSLELLLIHFWGIIIFIAPLMLGTVICLNFLGLIRQWVPHHWDLSEFSNVGCNFIFKKIGI